MKDLISIIIPIYNCENFISKCLNSIINQDYLNTEILLIDDGSTDDSYKICNSYAKKDKRIKVVTQTNGGPSSARNTGISLATGKYIMFIDSDDYLDKDVLSKCIENYNKNKLVAIKHKRVINSNIDNAVYEKNNYLVNDYLNNIFTNKIIGSAWGYLYETKIVKEIKFDLNTRCMEDTIFFINYLKKSKVSEIKFIENSYYYYVLNEESITEKKYNNTEEYIERFKNYNYSLNIINKLTNKKYNNLINNKKIIILENQMSNLKISIKEYKKIREKFSLPEFKGNSIRYKIFSKLYIKKFLRILKYYYILLKIGKGIKKGR